MNLLQQLDDFLTTKASNLLDRKHIENPDVFFRKVVKKTSKLAEKPSEWLYEFEANLTKQLKTLDDSQKQSLTEYVKTLSFQEFSWYMALLCRILDMLEQNDELETELGITLLANHEYLKLEVSPQLYPEETKHFNKQLQEINVKESNLPVCPKCGSNLLVNYGISYYCKTCGKQTRKYLIDKKE